SRVETDEQLAPLLLDAVGETVGERRDRRLPPDAPVLGPALSLQAQSAGAHRISGWVAARKESLVRRCRSGRTGTRAPADPPPVRGPASRARPGSPDPAAGPGRASQAPKAARPSAR